MINANLIPVLTSAFDDAETQLNATPEFMSDATPPTIELLVTTANGLQGIIQLNDEAATFTLADDNHVLNELTVTIPTGTLANDVNRTPESAFRLLLHFIDEIFN